MACISLYRSHNTVYLHVSACVSYYFSISCSSGVHTCSQTPVKPSAGGLKYAFSACNYGSPPAILADSHSVLTAVVYFFFLPHSLRVPLADCHQTLLHVRQWPRFMKFGKKFQGPFHPKFGGPKTWNFREISDNFATWRRISPEHNKTSSVGKGVANYGHSGTGKLNSVCLWSTNG